MINRSRTNAAILATALIITFKYQSALGAALMPEPSLGFSPHTLYAIDQQTAIAAMHKALSGLSIAELTSTGTGITTDYIDGTSTTNGGKTTHSRYQYAITFRPMMGNHTAVNVVTRIESSTTADGAPPNWHDATLFNLGLARKASGWLYERYERVLAGASIEGPVAQTSPGLTTPASATRNAQNTDSQSRGAASDFDIVGLRLGMTADEVRGALRAMKMPVYKEYTDSLSYQTKVSNAIVEVPNSGFVSAIYAGTANPTGHSSERFLVFFTPDSGHERALEIVHSVGVESTSPMLVQNFQDGVTKKYGKPTFSPSMLAIGSNWLMWANAAFFDQNSCVTSSSTFAFRDPAPTARDMRNPAIDADQRQLENFKRLCGSSYLAISFDHTTTVAGSAAMIGYSARLVSPQLTLDGLFAAGGKIQAASRASDLKDVDKAAHQEGPKL